MFFMIGLFPKSRILLSLILMNPATGQMEQGQIVEYGNQLSLFFIPIWTFQKQYFVEFPASHTVCQIEGLTREQIVNASRLELESHMKVIRQQNIKQNCPFCGYPLNDDFRYCPGCGRDLR